MARLGALMGIMGYWILLIILFSASGSPFAGTGFTVNSTMNVSGHLPENPGTPGVLDQLFYLLQLTLAFIGFVGQILLFLVLGIGLPASYPTSVQLIFTIWNFFIFVVAVAILISFIPGES